MIPGLWDLLEYTLESLHAPIIWSNQNAARIAKPYIVLNCATLGFPQHDHYGQVDDDGVRNQSSWRRATVDLQFYCGWDSLSLADRACMLLKTDRSLDKQVQLDVAIGDRLTLTHVPALLNESQFEERAVYSFDYFYTQHVDENVGVIEEVCFEGKFFPTLTDGLSCEHCVRAPYARPEEAMHG